MPKTAAKERIDVLLLLGSLSDKALAADAKAVFDEFGVSARYEVCSAHRDHTRLAKLVPAAEADGAQVFIACAGMAAHLPGVVAALTVKPVIGVPGSSGLLGLDALLAIAQMPPGIPVACVGIDGGRNAALLAVEILATARPELAEKLHAFRTDLARRNRADSAKLKEQLGSK
jgi:5-(carboxyamino)imidazole ribonucleotide mutase